jgi:hypothetical protein
MAWSFFNKIKNTFFCLLAARNGVQCPNNSVPQLLDLTNKRGKEMKQEIYSRKLKLEENQPWYYFDWSCISSEYLTHHHHAREKRTIMKNKQNSLLRQDEKLATQNYQVP